jgi:viologen exporter family transport system permease protein
VKVLHKFAAEYRAAWHLAIEYRLAVFIWMFSMVLPLVMLAGWLSIAEGGPVGRFGKTDFLAYYVAAILVRNLTGVWIIWDLDSDIRLGEMSFKLLKPLNPIVHYVAQSLSAKPMRLAVLMPLVAGVEFFVPSVHFEIGPLMLLLFFLALAGTWSMLFFIQYTNGLLAFWITQAIGINDMWFGVFSLFSGYLIPLDLFPPLIRSALYALPFRYMMSFPIEIFTGRLGLRDIGHGIALQWIWVGVFYVVYRVVWMTGLKKYAAVGA